MKGMFVCFFVFCLCVSAVTHTKSILLLFFKAAVYKPRKKNKTETNAHVQPGRNELLADVTRPLKNGEKSPLIFADAFDPGHQCGAVSIVTLLPDHGIIPQK